MGIEGYVGRPGSGKSYTLTERALREAERGRDVFANYRIDHANAHAFGPDDLLELPPGLIVIDEAHLWFPARQALKLPPSWLALMSQTRKRGWDLLWAAQHEARVDRVIRDVSLWLWRCQAWFPWNGHPLMFVADSYEPEDFRKPGKRNIRTTRWYRQRIAEAYDTYDTLAVARHAQSDRDAYSKGA